MLKKSTVAVLTAMATMLSTFGSMTTNAAIVESEETVTTSTAFAPVDTTTAPPIINTVQTSASTPVSTTTSYETIPERAFAVTTATAPPNAPDILPISNTKEVTVCVVDGDTNEHIKGVKVHIVETESVESRKIKRDFGILDTDEEDSCKINFDYTLEKDTDVALLTAVLEEIPNEYAPNPYFSKCIDFIADASLWQYYNEAHTSYFYIPLYKKTQGSFKAVCQVIDSSTGKPLDNIKATLMTDDYDGNIQVVDEWVTSGGNPYTLDVNYDIPKYSPGQYFELQCSIPDGYQIDYNNSSNADYCYIEYNQEEFPDTVELTKYLEPIPPYQTATSSVTDYPSTDTTTAFSQTTTKYDTTTTIAPTTTIATTTPQKRNCEICGKEINSSDGIITPLGIFVCKECRSAGAGGTTAPPFSTTTAIFPTTTTKINDTDSPTTTTRKVENINILHGDANADNDVTVADAVLIMQSLANSDEYQLSALGMVNADVYNCGDGVTSMDALTIQEVMADKISLYDLPIRFD